MSKLYHAWYMLVNVIEEMDALPAELRTSIADLVRYRWDYGCTIVQGAAYMFDPEFWDCDPDDYCEDSWYKYKMKIHPEPDQNDYVDEDLYEAELAKHLDLHAKIDRQALTYKRKEGVFARKTVQNGARESSAVDFWDMYGNQVPELQVLVMRLVGCVSGACESERGHKEMNFIKSKLRNRLSIPTTNALLYVRINLELVYREINFTSSLDPILYLEQDEPDELDVPNAWRVADADEDAMVDEAAAAAAAERSASIARGVARTAAMRQQEANAARGAPRLQNEDAAGPAGAAAGPAGAAAGPAGAASTRTRIVRAPSVLDL